MKNERMKELKKEIRKAKVNNTKQEIIKNLKVFNNDKITRNIALLCAAATVAIIAAPSFKSTKYLHKKTEIDSFGKYNVEEQYDSFESSLDTITYYSDWEKNDNNEYSRKVEKYKLKSIPESYLVGIINSLNETDIIHNSDFINLFGRKISEETETISSLSETEIKKGEHFKVIIYDYDENVYIIDEAKWENCFLKIMITLAANVSIMGFSGIFDEYITDEKRKKIIEQEKEISEEYNSKKIDIKPLVRELELIQNK